MNRYHWNVTAAADNDAVAGLSDALDIPRVGAALLASRGLTEVEAARRFLNPSDADVVDPFRFDNMERAIEAVQRARERRQPVLIHGDYDVDGISGTALLYHYLNGVFDDVRRFVPDRRKDGYGVASRAVEWAISEKVGLFIAVDCGTSDADLIEKLEAAGVDVVVCDHHEFPTDGRVPGIMLNPSRPGESYPNTQLCGTGVAFKFVEALHASGIRGRVEPGDLIDLVALATVGDVAPLRDENRYFVRRGLKLINERPRAGLGAIRTFTRLGQRPITASHLAFVFAPRINAPGRVAGPKPSLEILCEAQRDTAMQLASTLEGHNERRRELTTLVETAAVARIEAMTNRDATGAFVLAGDDWDEGVLGIAASRVAESFGRPAILLSVKDGVAKGSGRSVPGVNLKAQLDELQTHIERYGGHAQAVGLTMKADGVESFARALSSRVREFFTPTAGMPLTIDQSITMEECGHDLLGFIARCEPFGHGNAEPVWCISDVQILRDTCIVGESHMKIFFQDTSGNPGNAIAFGWDRAETPDDLIGRTVDIAVTIRRGEYMGRVYPELRLIDIRLHGSSR